MDKKEEGYYSSRPWIKAYEGVFKESLEPYPEIPVFEMLNNASKNYPDVIGCVYREREITYKDLKEHVDRFATALSDLGIKKGDRVAIILENIPQFIIADYGILRAGGVSVPCSPLHSIETLEHEIGSSGAKGVICYEKSLDLVKSLKDTSIEFVITTTPEDYTKNERELKESNDVYQFVDLVKRYDPNPPSININPKEDLALLQFTGGTTGLPKGVMLTHFNLVANVIQTMPWLLCSLADQFKGNAEILLALPFFHVYGHWALNVSIYMALTMLLVRDARDYEECLRLAKKYDPAMQIGVPTQFMKLLAKEELKGSKVLGVSGSAALHPKIAEKYEELTGAPVTEGYGLSETSPVTHYNIWSMCKYLGLESELSPKVGSIGVPVPDTDVKVVDLETGEEVPPGESGEMYIKGHQLMKGYWPTPGKGLTKDGWLPTGDVVRMDEDGYFYIVDRTKDMINVSGMKVYSKLIDDLLEKRQEVEVAATIGIPDPERPGSERVKIFIVPKKEFKGKITKEDVIKYCRENLEPYSVPKDVEFRDELPLTPTLKVWKKKLRDEEIEKMKEKGLLKDYE
ncbi:MAG: hypothetical protein EF806_05000 [Candidatus Methanoliparum thermophilum]|uniref:Long-chain fatty acid--CoA ligase n=1 Tax=Methanoliparum thermophilum TaxID=2491083 RepID=A0A520KRF9_METT2|nr:MAG: hypothetical protein EF806_05000 [Candidatus Methanoliparum thermophilum]